MQQVFEFFFAAWPLVVAAVLAFVMIRASRRPKRHDARPGSERTGDDGGDGGD